MSREDIQKRFEFFLTETEKHISILEENLFIIKKQYPFDECKIKNLIEDKETLKILDQIAYRFLKNQESIGKLLRYFLLKEGELVEHLSMIDIIHKLEKLGIFIDENFWFDMRNLRNSLVHEYPEMYEEVAESINTLYEYVPKIKEILNQIKEKK